MTGKIIRTIYTKSVVKRNKPENLSLADDMLFSHEYERLIPPSNLLLYKNVLVTYDGIVFDNFLAQPDLVVCYESDLKPYRYRYLLSTLLKKKRRSLKKDRKYILIFDNYSGPKGIAHWLGDSLTRIVEVKEYLKDHVAILPSYFKEEGYHKHSLQIFGDFEKQYIEKDEYLTVPYLVAPTHLAPTGNYLPDNVIKLRSQVWEKNTLKMNFSLGDKIYLSRKKASRRFVLNEPEVEKILENFGFKSICIEDLSFNEQVSVMGNTKYLVSVHGGGLANIHFMPSKAKVLELRSAGDNINNMYYSLCSALDIKYYYQLCETEYLSEIANNFNVSVDTPELMKNLSLMLNNS
jgi:hypothetical protein